MRSTLLLAAIPLAAALPHSQPVGGVLGRLRHSVKMDPVTTYSATIPSDMYSKLSDKTGDTVVVPPLAPVPAKTVAQPANIPETEFAEPAAAAAAEQKENKKESKPAPKDEKKKNSAQSSEPKGKGYQDTASNLHNSARKNNPVKAGLKDLTWTDDLHKDALDWAKGCNYTHAEMKLDSPGTVAENIAWQEQGATFKDELSALNASFESWYDDELPWFNPAQPDVVQTTARGNVAAGKKKATSVGHVKNILSDSFNEFAVASYLCTTLNIIEKSSSGVPVVKRTVTNGWFSVARFSGPVASNGQTDAYAPVQNSVYR
ncbi:cysteine-rich secretory protein family protein [Hirsutella rhossiliensis]|uniref:Cysteine-rich secretory protein family domain-containing protein n=1 Tax=Hirsutella rhossiliensis TaxID=111463 RepID=A0A9P8N457_9HYPO|nr:cysteine-rich secretory protein family domain-containing protein [Hirsutella rhossiliensis]KAH0964347.1 cysteine-rich secretory protein family domain-containing protein [Hirsutella rhossiliensis]